MEILPSVLHTLQAVCSTYGTYLSYHSITSLRRYEEKSEKAAKWSNTAEHQLYRTRVTQAGGLGAILLSLVTSLYLLVGAVSTSSGRTIPGLFLSAINLVVITAAYFHITAFWRGKAKVPFVEGFNEGITRTNQIRQLLCTMGGLWVISGCLQAMGIS